MEGVGGDGGSWLAGRITTVPIWDEEFLSPWVLGVFKAVAHSNSQTNMRSKNDP